MKKGNGGVTFLIILLFATVIILSVYILVGNGKVNNGEEEGKYTGTSKTVLYEDASKEIVYAIKRQSTITLEDGSYNTVELPYINISSPYALEINSAIQSMYLNSYNDYEYFSYLNDNILSVVIDERFQGDGIRNYMVYNIDIYTGERVSNKEIFASIGTTEDKVKEVLQQSYHNAFLLKFPTISELYEDYTQSTEYKSTVSEENLSLDVPMFLGLNKSLKLVGKIYSPAGAIYYYSIVDISL